MKYLYIFLLFCCLTVKLFGQHAYGTTGLLFAPTAEMQKDKTIMIGGSMIDHHTYRSNYWKGSREYTPYTYNYYLNVTIFPWLEVAYTCTLVKGAHGSSYWPQQTWGKFVNQDRSFHGRLRLWKEGWWKQWTPQIVLGANDAIGDSWNGGSFAYPSETTYGNGYWNRYYLAVTKHVIFQNIGELGAHLTWIYSTRFDNNLNSPAIGVNFQLKLKGKSLINKLVNGVNLMVEVVPGYTEVNEDLIFNPDSPKYQVNLGMEYSFWKDYINAIVELNRCRYFSGGIVFKIHIFNFTQQTSYLPIIFGKHHPKVLFRFLPVRKDLLLLKVSNPRSMHVIRP